MWQGSEIVVAVAVAAEMGLGKRNKEDGGRRGDEEGGQQGRAR